MPSWIGKCSRRTSWYWSAFKDKLPLQTKIDFTDKNCLYEQKLTKNCLYGEKITSRTKTDKNCLYGQKLPLRTKIAFMDKNRLYEQKLPLRSIVDCPLFLIMLFKAKLSPRRQIIQIAFMDFPRFREGQKTPRRPPRL